MFGIFYVSVRNIRKIKMTTSELAIKIISHHSGGCLSVSYRFVPGEVNITFTSVEELSSTRTGSLLLLTASKSKKHIHPTQKKKHRVADLVMFQ